MYVSPITDALINILSDVWKPPFVQFWTLSLSFTVTFRITRKVCRRLYKVRDKITSALDEKYRELYDPMKKHYEYH